MALRPRQLPKNLGLFQEFLAPQLIDFLGSRIGGRDGVAFEAVADRGGEIFLDGDVFAEIDAPAAIHDAESARAQHFFQPPLP